MNIQAKDTLNQVLAFLPERATLKNTRTLNPSTIYYITEIRAYFNIALQSEIGASTLDKSNKPQKKSWERLRWDFAVNERLIKFNKTFDDLGKSEDANNQIVRTILENKELIIHLFKKYVFQLEKEMTFIENN